MRLWSDCDFISRLLLLLIVTRLHVTWANKNRHHKSTASNSGANSVKPPPVFDPTTIQEVTTTVGQTAFLHCRVRYLADRRVLWMRQRDLHVLTSSLHTYTSDWRISSIHSVVRDHHLEDERSTDPDRENGPFHGKWFNNSRSSSTNTGSAAIDDEQGLWSEWTLRIRSAQVKDAGLYECQVSTEPKISRIYRLNVVVSKASILGSAELFVKKGSDINLTCIAIEAPEPPSHFFWYHGGQVLNYSARGGLSVMTDKVAHLSRLLVARADAKDSGNYTCAPSGAHPASVVVHVLNGEQPAAMQRDNSANGIATRPPLTSSYHFLVIVIVSTTLLWPLSDIT